MELEISEGRVQGSVWEHAQREITTSQEFSVDQLKTYPNVSTRHYSCSSGPFFSPEEQLEHVVEMSAKVVPIKSWSTENPLLPSFWSQLRVAVFNTMIRF